MNIGAFKIFLRLLLRLGMDILVQANSRTSWGYIWWITFPLLNKWYPFDLTTLASPW
jgi:hypothetical protein